MSNVYEPTVKGAPEDIKPGEPNKVDKDYTDIIQSNVDEIDKKVISETGVPTDMYYYSPEHKKLIKAVKRVGKKLKYVSDEEDTKGAELVMGTKRSLMNYYKLREEDFEAAPQEK